MRPRGVLCGVRELHGREQTSLALFLSKSHSLFSLSPYPLSMRFQTAIRLPQLLNPNAKPGEMTWLPAEWPVCASQALGLIGLRATLPCLPSPAPMKTQLLAQSCSNASFESLPTYREHSPSLESALCSPKEEECTVKQTDLEDIFCAPRRAMP